MQFIVISALGSDRTGLVYDLTRVVLDCTGNIVDSRMSALGSEFAMLLLVSGNWHTLAKLETELKKLSDASGITVSVRRTEQRPRAQGRRHVLRRRRLPRPARHRAQPRGILQLARHRHRRA